MQRFRSLAAVIVMAGGAFAAAPPDTTSVGGTPADSSAAGLPDSLSLASAASFADTLAVLERTLRAFEALQQTLPADVVCAELVAAVRESQAAGDIEAAAILSHDAWECLGARRR